MKPEDMTPEWARKFFTDPHYSGWAAIDIYAHAGDIPVGGDILYYLGIAVREFMQGEG